MRVLFTTFYDPNYLGIRYLAAVLKEAGHDVCICQLKDYQYPPVSPMDISSAEWNLAYTRHIFINTGTLLPISLKEEELFHNAIKQYEPDILAFTNRSPYNYLLPNLLSIMKQAAPHAFLVGGGFGPTYQPEIALRLGANAVIRGEGESALLQLVEAIEHGHDWHKLNNISYLDGETVINNPLNPLIRDLDAQPFALYYGDHFIYIENNQCQHIDMRHIKRIGTRYNTSYMILGGRGCIGNCTYCAGGHWRDQYRQQGFVVPPIRSRSLENIFEECLIAKEHQEKEIIFADEYFVRPTQDLINFFTRYKEEINIPFYAHFHHKQLISSPELVDVLCRAGIMYISFGIQSASESFAKRVYRRHNSNSDLLKALKLCEAKGLNTAYHIIGANALETEEDIEELFNFTAQLPFDASLKTDRWIHSQALRLLEGSPLVQMYPSLRDIPYSPRRYGYYVVLAEIRTLVDEQTFNKIRNNPFYKDRPDRLIVLFNTLRRDAHQAYLQQEIQRLKGQKVYFWGCGETYQYKKHLFKDVHPQCFLADIGSYPNDIDGIPVYEPEKILPYGEKLPIIIFASTPNTIYKKIRQNYPSYEDVIACVCL